MRGAVKLFAHKLLDPPAALLSDGKLLVNATCVTGEQVDTEKALAPLKSGRRVFVGTEMSKAKVAASMGGSALVRLPPGTP